MTMTEAGEVTPMGPAKSGAAELSAEEEAATAKFLENVNKWREARQMGEVSHEDDAHMSCQAVNIVIDFCLS